MRKLFGILLILISTTVQIFSQTDYDFPALNEAGINDSKFIQSKYFDGNALWGHIDGGADLYIEYGFDKLLFQEVQINKINFRIEYYRMKDPAAAFGVFSVSRFKCDESDTLTNFICITRYQVQSAIGRFYISISNDKGTPEAKELTVKLFKMILGKLKEPAFELPGPFNKELFKIYSASCKLFRGILGLQNGMPLWADVFEKFSGFEIFVLPYENKDGYLNFARIKFSNEQDKIRFMRSIGVAETKTENRYITRANGILYIVKTIGNSEIYFYETVFGNEELKNILGE